MDKRSAVAAGFIVVTLIYAVLSTTWVSSDPGWYDDLRKPGFQPPDLVFGIIWPLNFVALGVVGVLASRRDCDAASILLGVFAVSVFFALSWAYLFYVPHQLVAAAMCLAIAAALTWVMLAQAWAISPYLGLSLVAYAGWMSVATALSVAYARVN